MGSGAVETAVRAIVFTGSAGVASAANEVPFKTQFVGFFVAALCSGLAQKTNHRRTTLDGR